MKKNPKKTKTLTLPIEAMAPTSPNDVLVTAIMALEKANENLAMLAHEVLKPVPNKALDKLFEAMPDIITAYLTMQQAERAEARKRATTSTPTTDVFGALSTLTEHQRGEILKVCTGSQQKMLLELFALVPTPIRPPAS